MPSEYRTTDCLADIIENSDRIAIYIEGHDRAMFERDLMRRDATERCLERISEATARLGTRFIELLPNHSFRNIKAAGNWFRHAYHRVDTAVVWDTATEILPSLRADAANALAKLGADQA